jgi:hypothetical protein
VAGAKGASPESFSDALGDIHIAIANAKLSPDADLGFLNQLEMVVMGRLKHPDQSKQPGGAQPPGSGQPGGGGPGQPPGQAGPPPPGGPANAPPPQGGPAPHASIPPPDMDDVRKTIAQTTGP